MSSLGQQQRAQRLISRTATPHVDSSVQRIMPLLERLGGEVLEIGPGAGNLAGALPAGITYTGLEPNVHLHEALAGVLQRSGVARCRVVAGSAEHLPFGSESFDAVISVRTLCSMKNVEHALQEIRRVLRPGGQFIFVEHVAARRASWRWWLQQVARPVHAWQYGCSPAVDIAGAIQQAGFARVQITNFQIGGRLNIVGRLRIFGVAEK